MAFSSFAVAALLTLGSVAAHATVSVYFDQGTINAGTIVKTEANLLLPGDFWRQYAYKLDQTDFPDSVSADVGFNFTEIKFKSITDIDFTGHEISVIDENGTVLWHATPTSGPGKTADTVSFDSVVVNTRKFIIDIKGTVIGAGDAKGNYLGSYTFSFLTYPSPDVTSVPEPQSYALALSGLALAGMLLNRRRNNNG